ncbi:MAG TPA: hypothetical protein VKQ30_18695 [Ktedonobacterales bacterium]|nr:hypothetical protein [Ktedonobacterales bacterium]
MSNTLDRLHEMGDFLMQLARLDYDALMAALSEGSVEGIPEWASGLPKGTWALSQMAVIRSASAILQERLTPPDAERKVVASVEIAKLTIRPYTPEEREARRRGEHLEP